MEPNYWCLVPIKLVRYSKTAAILYGLIWGLSNKEGYCFATNKYLMEIMDVSSEQAIQQHLSTLKKSGWIEVEIIDGNKRRIYPKVKIGGTPKKNLGGAPRKTGGPYNNIYNNKTNINILPNGNMGKNEINSLIDKFKNINPSYEKFFSNKTQRSALERMLKKTDVKKLGEIIDLLPETSKSQYAPVITSPTQLEDKLGQLIIFIQKENSKGIQSI